MSPRFGRGVKIPPFIERRVRGNEINGRAIPAAQNIEILAVKQRAVLEIRHLRVFLANRDTARVRVRWH